MGSASARLVLQLETSHDAPVTLEIDSARTALVLLDYQNYNVHPNGYWAQAAPGSAERAAPAVARAAEVLAAARRAGITVVHVQNAWRDGHPDVNPHTPWQADAKAAGRSTEGTWGIEFVEALAPIAGELVVRKRAVSGFAGTELDRLLHIHDISTLVIAGIITNYAVAAVRRERDRRDAHILHHPDPPLHRRGRHRRGFQGVGSRRAIARARLTGPQASDGVVASAEPSTSHGVQMLNCSRSPLAGRSSRIARLGGAASSAG